MRYLLIFLFPVFAVTCLVSNTTAQKNVYEATVGNGIQKVEVLAGEYFFDPDYIIVKVDVPVELKVRKEPSIIPHDFVIKASEAGIDILESLSTEPKSIKFTPTKVGKYQFYCDKKLLFFKSHREKGMEGVLEVIETDSERIPRSLLRG